MARKTKILVVILLIIISFGAGYMKGSVDTVSKMIDIGSELLEIDLSPRAKQMFISNPALAYQIIEGAGATNYTNPFAKHPQASVHFEYCMLTRADYDGCYATGINKYGEWAND